MDDGTSARSRLILSVSDQVQLSPLTRHLESVPGIEVERGAARTAEGEQGAMDVLTVVAGSGGLIAAIKVLPEFLRARRSDVTITVALPDERTITVDVTNVQDAMAVLERLING
ncbi:hypothetical protein GCM10009839_01680 [Catenulispora yoronensis]|uniref:ACT domain-containing protein n=1 Tax=Catenulispora yoronensis TaxID=450799 RepID=A0ABP5EXW1_9ACTN